MSVDRTFSVAPMMAYTDRHFRYLVRLMSRHALLFTEMITAQAILHGDQQKLLGYAAFEHPIVAQLGGNDPAQLAAAAQVVEAFGYDEVNLNVGCPSERVHAGCFGASLMLHPALVAECVAAMKQRVNIPVSVKCRIGVDDHDSYAALCQFVRMLQTAGCDALYVHARKAWLKGLSPKENRTIPPLNYPMVHQLHADFPTLPMVINGGINTLEASQQQLTQMDGVMVGREIYANPNHFLALDQTVFADTAPVLTRHQVVSAYLPYISAQLAQGVPLKHISRHVLGFFKGIPGGKRWRQYLSDNAFKADADVGLIEHAMVALADDYLTASAAVKPV